MTLRSNWCDEPLVILGNQINLQKIPFQMGMLRKKKKTMRRKKLGHFKGAPPLPAQGVSNSILLPKLFWPTGRKICYTNREKLLKFEAESREFAKKLWSLEQFIQAVKNQNNFWEQNAFLTCLWRFLMSHRLEQL